MDKRIVIDGHFISEKVAQVVQAIREYSPEIVVEWIPPRQRKPGQDAFRIGHAPVGQEPYFFMTVKREEDMDARVLKRIIAGDQRNGKALYSEVEAAEEAARRIAHQKVLDNIEEANEMAYAVLRSPKDTYKINDNLIFKEGVPGNYAHRK